MKYVVPITIAVILCSCKEPAVTTPVEVRLPHSDLVGILRDHLPEDEAIKIDSPPGSEDQFYFELTSEEFDHLRYAFTNKVRDYTSNVPHSYDRFSSRTTTVEEGFSTFAFSFGKGVDYHYIITGSFVQADSSGKVTIWIKPTRG